MVVWLIYFVKIAIPVVIAYKILGGQPFKLRGVAAFAVAATGLFAFYEGFDLARMEEARTRYGRVTPGVVVEKLSTLERNGTRYIGRLGGRDQVHRLPVVTSKGFAVYQQLSRWIATGSPHAWVIAYHFSCDASRPCGGRDFVAEATWSRLRVGQSVNVRKVDDEPYSARLDDNPQWTMALIELGLGTVLLFAARLVSGRPLLFRSREWLTAPAVVLRVDPVKYLDTTRWRIHFAYFDANGQAHESADEVITGTWKAGDGCIARFPREAPDLATMSSYDTDSSA